MDYGKLLSRAWEITWRWKVLWILGFLASLAQLQNGGGGSGYRFDAGQGPAGLDIPPGVISLLVALGCLMFFIGIALWVVSVIARGGLIAGVQQVEEEGSTSFGSAWRMGTSRFWTLVGIGLLTALPMILVVVTLIGAAAALILGTGVAVYRAESPAVWSALAPMLICCLPLLCLVIIAAMVLGQIRIYAERAAVLDGLGWIDAFKRGWGVLRENLGPTVMLWFIFVLISLVIGSIVLAVGLSLAAPFLAILFSLSAARSLFSVALIPLVCGGLVAGVVGAVFGSVVETFQSATWTLAYRELTRAAVPPPADPEPER